MDDLLKTWGVPEDAIREFQRNSIEESHLPHITEEQLKELCPVMGVRINIKNKIAEYLEAQAPTETATNATDTSLREEVNLVDEISFSLTDLFPIQTSFRDFDLNTLLTTSPCGKSILQYYAVNKCLDTKRRNRLTDIIIRHLYTHIVNHRLTYEDYNVIGGKIITTFPKVALETYFTKPIKKRDSHSGKSVAARGKLIDKVRNILFESGEKRRRVSTADEPNCKKSSSSSSSQLESHKEVIEWLCAHHEPWSEVLERWKLTAEVRHSQEYKTIEDMIVQWPILNSPNAVDLIEEDFKFLYPEKTDFFSKNWHTFFNELTSLKNTEINSDIYRETLFASMKYMDLEENKIPSQLTLLVHLVPPKGRYSKKNKFSVQECLDSIIIIVENPGDISTTVTQQKEKALERKQPVQPYLILLGNLQNIRQLYLVVDKIRYTFNSSQKAFDALFKCYHVFNAKYPKAGDHILLIVQRCVYDIVTKYDNVVPYIADILNLKKSN